MCVSLPRNVVTFKTLRPVLIFRMGGEDPSSRPAYPYSAWRGLRSRRNGQVRCQAPIRKCDVKVAGAPPVLRRPSQFRIALVTGPGPGRGSKSERRRARGVRGLVSRVDAARDDAVPALARGGLPGVFRDVRGEEI